MEYLKRFQGFLPESHGQNLAVTVLYVLSSLESGLECFICAASSLDSGMRLGARVVCQANVAHIRR